MKTFGIVVTVLFVALAPAVIGAQLAPASLYETSKASAAAPTVPAPAAPAAIPADWTNALTGFIVGGVPVLVMLLKKLLPASVSNYIPLIATMLGPVVAFMASKAVDHSISPIAATLLGLGSVGLRELLAHLTREVAAKL